MWTIISTIWDLSENKLKKINSWCNKNGLTISEIKTQIVLWTEDRHLKHPPHVTITEVEIELKSEAKYLDITIDKNLNWRKHIDDVVSKCLKCIFDAKKAIGKKWVLSPATIKWIIYTMVIQPKMTHGTVVWGTDLSKTKKRNLQQLNRIQHLISTLMTNSSKSTSQGALNTLLDLDPIDIFLEKQHCS